MATKIGEDGKYLAQCRKCGAWLEVRPESFRTELFFEVLQATFICCGMEQSATFTIEKDTIDFH